MGNNLLPSARKASIVDPCQKMDIVADRGVGGAIEIGGRTDNPSL
jgi:hypothetical protein